MVIWSIGLGTGLQTQLGGFDSYYHLNGFGGNPRIDDESMSTKTTERSRTKDGSYLTLEWSITISRYKLPRWRNGSVFVLHTNGGGSIPSRGTMLSSHYTRGAGSVYWKVKVVRIRQPDCKSGPHGSGSSPLLSTKWWISVWKNVDNSDYNKRNYNPLPVHSKTTIKQSRVRRNGYLTIILIGD